MTGSSNFSPLAHIRHEAEYEGRRKQIEDIELEITGAMDAIKALHYRQPDELLKKQLEDKFEKHREALNQKIAALKLELDPAHPHLELLEHARKQLVVWHEFQR